MVRTKYEDTVYEEVKYTGKIFMYSSISWQVLFPIVDIIRLLKKNTVIGFKYGKGQQLIKMYGSQYSHCMLGYDLKNKNDYLVNLKAVKNIFIFSDESDIVATNLMSAAKKNKMNVICYSNLDRIYHFYNNNSLPIEKNTFKTPEEVIEKMYYLLDLEGARKIADLFPDFEIIDHEIDTSETSLDKCSKILKECATNEKKQKETTYAKIFDPHLNKLKKMEYEHAHKNTIYPDSVEYLVQKENNKRKTLLSKFFSK